MNEQTSEDEPPPRWLRATVKDVANVNFEGSIKDINEYDCYYLNTCFQKAASSAGGDDVSVDTAEVRVLSMLAAITSMRLKPNEPNEPFGPMMVLADGRQTPALSDFKSHADVVAALADRSNNPVLRARLSDIAWTSERKRTDQGIAAIAAYTRIVKEITRGLLTSDGGHQNGFTHKCRDQARRALQISRATGWEKSEAKALCELLQNLKTKVVASGMLIPIYWVCELDLDYTISDPSEIGALIENILKSRSKDFHHRVELYRLAARAFHRAKKEEDKNRCLAEAAEELSLKAEANNHSALLEAHHLSGAIAQLHGVPGKKERRKELRHRLVDVQAGIPDEMSIVSTEMDLREIVAQTEEAIRCSKLLDKFFTFANLTRSRTSQRLREDAETSIRKHPLSSLFEPTQVDRHGKTIARSGSYGSFGATNEGTIQSHIAQGEARWRQIVVSGKIEPARLAISERHFVSENLIGSFLGQSPFVPCDQLQTYSKAFARFFQGDFVGAIYVLAPLLEGLIRHVLILNGHEVTIFDDATLTQQDRTISSFYEQMRGEVEIIFTKPVAEELERLFLTKPGPHMRHKVAHALLDDWDPYGADAIYACWFIFRLCMLPLFSHQTQLGEAFAGTELAEV